MDSPAPIPEPKLTENETVEESIRVSLTTTPPWSPGRRDTGEAVIGVTLADPDVYRGKFHVHYQAKVLSMNIDVLAALGQDPDLTSVEWASGKLAHYVIGIVAARQEQTPSSFYGYNLVSILQKQLILSEDQFRKNRFKLSWMAIALCQQNATFDQKFEDILTANPGTYYYGIDEASMITMACLCLNTTGCSSAANAAEKFVSENLKTGLNVYSLGLGAQALIATGKTSYLPQIQKAVTEIKSKLRNVVEKMNNGLGVSQILPPFAKRSLLDIACLPPLGQTIEIFFTVEDLIMTNTTRQYNVVVSVPPNPTLLQSMQALQAQPDSEFSFGTISTSLGPMVITINGITRDENSNYWKILTAPDIPLEQGVAETYHKDGKRYIFNLTALNRP
ncbi:transcobalamin-2-like isoform X2 [Mizuhopecten yessoensis]|uniref:transcobalamin-2-like isoform X2 n=1 Tax=Mizuhopecten yessoensis TaxID=6573 RepID=UPI000B45AD07|nr:transcobalamin-2-like isoform X2 [Mizuhopecten yessoensis]